MIYKNISYTTKTFYGVTFKPGETKQVDGIINDAKMIRVDSLPKEPPASSNKTKPVASKQNASASKTQARAETVSEDAGVLSDTTNTNIKTEQGGKPNGKH